MTEYRFERVSEFNVKDLIIIFRDAFGYDLDLKEYKKKQNTQRFGYSYIGYIAYDLRENPVAFYGVYPYIIEYNEKVFLAAQAGEAMTHRDHYRKGLFTHLAMMTHELCKSKGVHGVFAFPNQNSYPGFTKNLGWTHFDDIIPYLIRVKCIPWIRLKNTFRLPQIIHKTWCRFILKSVKKGVPFANSCTALNIPVISHSVAFFEYKIYGENFLIKINKINVWMKFDDSYLLIGDMEKCEDVTFLKTIKQLKILAFIMGLPYLRFQTTSNTWAYNMFKKHGIQMTVKHPIVGINFTNEIPIEKLKFTGADNDTF